MANGKKTKLFEIYESDFQFAPTEEKIDSFADFQYGKLGAILSATQALALVAQTCHWSTKGRNFYEDHLLYERVYNTVNGFIDSIAERSVGLSKDGGIVNPLRLLKAQYVFVEETSHIASEDYNLKLYTSILLYKKLVTKCYKDIEADGNLTPGLENLLQGILDETESLEYLLGRTQSGTIG